MTQAPIPGLPNFDVPFIVESWAGPPNNGDCGVHGLHFDMKSVSKFMGYGNLVHGLKIVALRCYN